MKIKYLITLIVILALPIFLFSGTTGKIAGNVIDQTNGEPLIGCNVWIEGTDQGAATDLEGNFYILNIPPGNYTLRASMIGYSAVRMTDIIVSIDLTTTADFSLPTEAIAGEEVIVVAERALITKDLTATTAVVNSSTLEALPVTEISDVLELQAGFVDGHLRGGRSGEVAYWIDGVPVTDVYDGNTVVDINKNAVEEMQVISGAFNAEYGQAMSGIVNIVTKDGSNDFRGGMTLYGGDFLSANNDIFLNINKFNPISTKNIEGHLQGSIIPGKLFFYGNARWIDFKGAYEGQRIFKPNSVALTYFNDLGEPDTYIVGTDAGLDTLVNEFFLSQSGADMTNQALIDSMYNVLRTNHTDAEGDGKFVSMDWNRKLYGQLKLIWKISTFAKLKYTIISDNVDYQDYGADDASARNYKYNPDGILTRHRSGLTQLLQFNQSFGTKTFYSISLTRFDKKYNHRTYPESEENKYVHSTLALTLPYSFKTGGTENNIFERSTVTSTIKGDLTSQIAQQHLMKLGMEYRMHNLKYYSANLQPPLEKTAIDLIYDSPYLENPIAMADSTIHTSRYNNKPYEFSAYIQDKIEFDELIVNAGVRFDYFDPKGRILADPSDPSIFNPIRPENRYRDLNENGIQDNGEPDVTIAEREEYWYVDTSPKWKISPRLGVSFPITERGVVHFSYGHFFQIPRFELLYENPDFDLDQGTGNVGVIGNADMRPEKTVSGELGIQQQLTPNIAIDVTGYFRDIRDLTGTRADQISLFGGSATYSKLVNSDFAYVRGLVLALTMRESSGWSGNLDYTFQISKGSASDPRQAQEAVAGGALPEIQLVPLNWDQTNTINASVSYNAQNWGGSAIAQYGSGLPYTPLSLQDISALVRNSARRPASWNVDLRSFYRLGLGSHNMTFFVRIENLFDTLNHTNVYDDSGVADRTNQIKIAEKQNTLEFINSIDEWFTNETFYSRPRRIEFGVTYEF
jgi:outer membrane receptor for ferrienterochelin and colicin